jgi:malate dehydrogenase (oxaloacetate-decarboxylating)(NADP+)
MSRWFVPRVNNFTKHLSVRLYHAPGDVIISSKLRGIDRFRDASLNKGLAFSLEERQIFGIHGLLPARIKTQDEQVELCKLTFLRYDDDMDKYQYLADLQDRNERLFFRLIAENIESMMPIIYTPTVGQACEKFSMIYRKPRGLFVTLNDKGHIYDVLKNWPEPDVRAIVVTDGERILGLGDLGAQGMNISVGKLALYTALAGIKPHQCLPIVIDVGTNNKDLREDPLYVGLRQPRISGQEYYDFIDEFMEAVVKRYGQNALIQFEDFGNHNAFIFLDKYRDAYCTFNDDIQGTASVAIAGLLASERVTGKKISEHKILFLGAGEAGIGIADLCVKAMMTEGISQQEARDKIWMVDIDGLLAKDRPEGKLDGHKKYYAKQHKVMKDFNEVVKEVRPSILIGASAAGGAFTPEILQMMSEFNERPIIFALSNPTSKAECTATAAYTHTQGKCIFASGSPFGEVNYNGQIFNPGQGNNAYIFPGVALGVIASGTHHISDHMFLIAAKVISRHLSDDDIQKGSIYPPLSTIKECSFDIAIEIIEHAYSKNLASLYPEPKDKRAWLKQQLYNYNYENQMPITWPWPESPVAATRLLDPTIFKRRGS